MTLDVLVKRREDVGMIKGELILVRILSCERLERMVLVTRIYELC